MHAFRTARLCRCGVSQVSLLIMKLLLGMALVYGASAFHLSREQRKELPTTKRMLRASLTDSAQQTTALPGVQFMEEWLKNSSPEASWDENIKHARFGNNLRGLQWTGPPLEGRRKIVSIPSAKAISVDVSTPDWDAQLAMKLLGEVRKGEGSQFYAYIQHLTQSSSTLVSTAPFALRHWTPEQRTLLAGNPVGEQLLVKDEEQQQEWSLKYQRLGRAATREPYTDFCWAMEVVHSRAFKGQSVKTGDALVSLLAPIVAAAGGYLYLTSSPDPSIFALGSLALGAAAPIAFGRDRQTVSLLPFIDSANHFEQADSQIDFVPLTDSFQLTVGLNCVDAGTRQLYISYGQRSQADLLLNHGFLPNISSTSDSNSYITALAMEYIKSNK